MRVLLVASGSRSVSAVAAALRGWGHQVDQVRSGPEPASLAPCDVLLVDLDRPDGTGPRLCRQLRARTDVAVIGLAVRGHERHGVAALREGADDYLVWPTEVPELLARIDAVLRRSRPPPGGEQAVGRLRIHFDRHQVTVDGAPVPLTPKEFRLLAALARAPGTVVTRDRLMAEVWHTTRPGRSRTLDSHVTTLRTKLGPAATVENVRGVGYLIRAVP